MERHRAITRWGVLGAAPAAVLAACGQAGGASPPGAASAAPVALRVTSWLVEQPSVEAYSKHLVAPLPKGPAGRAVLDLRQSQPRARRAGEAQGPRLGVLALVDRPAERPAGRPAG